MILNIANIQHFSVGDGPGIRTTVFFKGCNLHCPWCHNPETISGSITKLYYKNLNKTEICGRKMTIEDVVRDVLEDKDYYTESGGGVTFSGGEVMLQADAALELAKQMKKEGISVVVDTAGNVPYSEFQKINDYVDLYLYDFKTAMPDKYKTIIGGDFSLVYDNLRRLLADGKKVQVRIPLIPDFNTDIESVQEMCEKLKTLGIQSVDLLPFHRLGSGKYEAMGLNYLYKEHKPFGGKALQNVEKQYAKYFHTKIE